MIEGRSDLWHVQLTSGDLEVLTLDQLDEAFQSGRIDESTMVLQGGALKWARLGDILGSDEEEAAAAPVPTALPAFASPLETASRQLVVPVVPFVERPAPDRVSQDLLAPSVRPLAYDLAPSAHSVGLMADDDFDPDLVSLRPSKKKFVFIGIAAGLLLAVGAVGLSKLSGAAAVDATASQANVVSAVAAAAQPAAAAPRPTPDTVNADALPGSRLSDDQKKMLAGMDKKLEDQQKAKAEAAAAKAAKKQSHFKFKGHGKSGLHNGGDAHDPLNASLNH